MSMDGIVDMHGDDENPNSEWQLLLKMEKEMGSKRGYRRFSSIYFIFLKLGFYFICHLCFCIPENIFFKVLLWLGSDLMFLIYPLFTPPSHTGGSDTRSI